MQFLGTRSFWEWLIITLLLIAVILFGRQKFQLQIQNGKPPSTSTLLMLAGLFFVLSIRATPTGDEPHYLIMTQSLLQDGDFDLRNNYEQLDYQAYYPDGMLDPHVRIGGDNWYPIHGIGLPIIACSFFGIGGRTGVVIMQVLLAAAGIRLLWLFLTRVGIGPKATSFAVLISAFTLPLASLAGQIFPEIPAFFLVTLALGAITAPALVGWEFVALLLSLVLLPWLHSKNLVIAAALLIAAAFAHHQRSAIPRLMVAGGLFIASVAALAFLTYQWYGVPLPGASLMMDEAPFERNWLIPLSASFFARPWVGLAGVLLDQQSGLFIAAPVFILAIPGLLLLWHRKRMLAVLSILIFASVYLPVGLYTIWYGGFSSPARLLTPAVPILALGIASLLDAGEQRAWKFFSILALPSLLHAYLMITLPSFTRYGDPISQHNYFISLLEQLADLNLTLLFPTFRNISPTTWLTTIFYLLAILLITFILMPHNSTVATKKVQIYE